MADIFGLNFGLDLEGYGYSIGPSRRHKAAVVAGCSVRGAVSDLTTPIQTSMRAPARACMWHRTLLSTGTATARARVQGAAASVVVQYKNKPVRTPCDNASHMRPGARLTEMSLMRIPAIDMTLCCQESWTYTATCGGTVLVYLCSWCLIPILLSPLAVIQPRTWGSYRVQVVV